MLPKKNHKVGIQARIIAMAREAEYTFGQILVRSGQNLTALLDSVKHSLLTSIPDFFCLYILRFVQSVQFLGSYLKTFWETRMQKKTSWNSQWQRPHKGKEGVQ